MAEPSRRERIGQERDKQARARKEFRIGLAAIIAVAAAAMLLALVLSGVI